MKIICDEELYSNKGRDQCHLTGIYRGTAYNKCNINNTQKQSNFSPFVFQKSSNYDCHLFFQKLVDKKNDKVKFDTIPKINGEYGCNIWMYSIYR